MQSIEIIHHACLIGYALVDMYYALMIRYTSVTTSSLAKYESGLHKPLIYSLIFLGFIARVSSIPHSSFCCQVVGLMGKETGVDVLLADAQGASPVREHLLCY
jgi:hypothetical protein